MVSRKVQLPADASSFGVALPPEVAAALSVLAAPAPSLLATAPPAPAPAVQAMATASLVSGPSMEGGRIISVSVVGLAEQGDDPLAGQLGITAGCSTADCSTAGGAAGGWRCRPVAAADAAPCGGNGLRSGKAGNRCRSFSLLRRPPPLRRSGKLLLPPWWSNIMKPQHASPLAGVVKAAVRMASSPTAPSGGVR